MARREVGVFTGWIAYTYSRAYRTRDPRIDPVEYPWVLDQPHVLTLVGTRPISAHWRLGGRLRLASGNPITPVAGSYYDATAHKYVALDGAIMSERLPAFAQLDSRLDRTWRHWDLYFDIQNITNNDNVEGVDYSTDYKQRTYTTGLPILPSSGRIYRAQLAQSVAVHAVRVLRLRHPQRIDERLREHDGDVVRATVVVRGADQVLGDDLERIAARHDLADHPVVDEVRQAVAAQQEDVVVLRHQLVVLALDGRIEPDRADDHVACRRAQRADQIRPVLIQVAQRVVARQLLQHPVAKQVRTRVAAVADVDEDLLAAEADRRRAHAVTRRIAERPLEHRRVRCLHRRDERVLPGRRRWIAGLERVHDRAARDVLRRLPRRVRRVRRHG